MNPKDYAELDAIGLSDAIKNGQVTASAVIEIAIQVTEQLNASLNALVISSYDKARAFASARLPESPVSGAPFFLKDVNQFTSDMPTTFSCRFFQDADPKEDSELVRRWRAAGLVVLGKANTPEFAEDFVCEPTLNGPTLNPWNVSLTTGGSSGGAAAAVASGMVPVAHGTDLGGSIRIPAACCGVFGLKPTSGLNPIGPSCSELANGLNADHVLTRTVRDSAAVLDCTAGPMPGNRYQVPRKSGSYLQSLNEPLSQLRIGVCTTTPGGLKIGGHQSAAVEQVSAVLESMGHQLSEYRYPTDLSLGDWMENLWMVDIAWEIEKRIEETGREPEDHELEALTRFLLKHVKSLSAMDLYRARQRAHEVGVTLMRSMSELDLVLTPALGSDPVPVGYIDSRTEAFDFNTWGEKGHAFAPFAYICNLSGQPAAALPVQLAQDQHPSSVQLAGHHGKDHLILQVAAQLEAHFQWHTYRPPIWAGHLA